MARIVAPSQHTDITEDFELGGDSSDSESVLQSDEDVFNLSDWNARKRRASSNKYESIPQVSVATPPKPASPASQTSVSTAEPSPQPHEHQDAPSHSTLAKPERCDECRQFFYRATRGSRSPASPSLCETCYPFREASIPLERSGETDNDVVIHDAPVSQSLDSNSEVSRGFLQSSWPRRASFGTNLSKLSPPSIRQQEPAALPKPIRPLSTSPDPTNQAATPTDTHSSHSEPQEVSEADVALSQSTVNRSQTFQNGLASTRSPHLLCPFTYCPRSSPGSQLKTRWVFREHLKNDHGQSAQEAQTMLDAIVHSVQAPVQPSSSSSEPPQAQLSPLHVIDLESTAHHVQNKPPVARMASSLDAVVPAKEHLVHSSTTPLFSDANATASSSTTPGLSSVPVDSEPATSPLIPVVADIPPTTNPSIASRNDTINNLLDQIRQDLSHGNLKYYTEAEDRLIVYLKEDCGESWPTIYSYLLHRTGKNVLECRYSFKLKHRRAPWQVPAITAGPVNGNVATEAPTSSQHTVENAPGSSLESESRSRNDLEHRKRSSRLKGSQVSYTKFYPEALGQIVEKEFEQQVTPSSHTPSSHKSPMREVDSGPVLNRTAAGLSSSLSIDKGSLRKADERQRDINLVCSLTRNILRSPTIIFEPCDSYTRFKKRKRPLISTYKPYLRCHEREFISNAKVWSAEAPQDKLWSGTILHAGFSNEEVSAILDEFGHHADVADSNPGQQLLALAEKVGTSQLLKVMQGTTYARSPNSVTAFLDDVKHQSEDTKTVSWLSFNNDREAAPTSISRMLRHREIGHRNASSTDGFFMIHGRFPSHASFHGTSGDAHALAWSPDGETFAVGSTAVTDTHSMQYNNPNNLLVGSIETMRVQELTHHIIARPSAQAAAQTSQDPFLFTSVTSMAFSTDSNNDQVLYSAGYDNYLRLWWKEESTEKTSPASSRRILHTGPVDLLAVSHGGLIVTGARTANDPIRIFNHSGVGGLLTQVGKMSSKRALERGLSKMFPTALSFNGHFPHLQRHVLCGFSADENGATYGDTMILDLERNIPLHVGSLSVFDAAWSPEFGRFAVASAAGNYTNRGVKSVVRIFDSYYLPGNFSVNARSTTELECPALDINDVRFNPKDRNLISVGCTNGRAYVWDIRKGDTVMHCFSHGPSLMALDESRDPEEVDTGIRFLSWGLDGRKMFTGSSDGIVSVWDPYRSDEDAYVGDIAQLESGIMSGSFSPDHSKLLLGEVNSAFTVLSAGQSSHDMNTFQLVEAKEEKAHLRQKYARTEDDRLLEESEETAALISRDLVKSGQIDIRRAGNFPFRQAVQGFNYSGPFDMTADAEQRRESAAAHQVHLRKTETTLRTDSTSAPVLTDDEFVDKELWKARIPGTMRACPERVAPACFRCGSTDSCWIGKANLDILHCPHCNLGWQANVLGYTFLGDPPTGPGHALVQNSLVCEK